MKKHQFILAGAGVPVLLALGGLLTGCSHQEVPPPLVPTTSAAPAPKSPEEMQRQAKQHGYTIPANAMPGNK